jgi:hypothetical protein
MNRLSRTERRAPRRGPESRWAVMAAISVTGLAANHLAAVEEAAYGSE